MNSRDLLERVGRGLRDGAIAVAEELRANPRARLGLYGVLLVLALAAGLRGFDHAAARQAEIAALRVQERELTALASPQQAKRWAQTDAAIAERLAEAKALLWSDQPVGVAHADFFSWVEETAKEAGLTGANIRLGDVRKLGAEGQITEMRVSFVLGGGTGGLTQETMYAFLRRIAEERRAVFARSLRLRFDQPMLIEVELAAFCLTAPEAPVGKNASLREGST